MSPQFEINFSSKKCENVRGILERLWSRKKSYVMKWE